jgi:hypothetical protein
MASGAAVAANQPSNNASEISPAGVPWDVDAAFRWSSPHPEWQITAAASTMAWLILERMR